MSVNAGTIVQQVKSTAANQQIRNAAVITQAQALATAVRPQAPAPAPAPGQGDKRP